MNNVSPSAKIPDIYPDNAYHGVKQLMLHGVVNHQKEYVKDRTITTRLKGIWSILKRAWYRSHRKNMIGSIPVFVAESVWKYNDLNDAGALDTFMHG